MKKLISNQISPNLKFTDFLVGFKALFQKPNKLDFSQFFGSENYFLCNSARVGLLKIIEVLNLKDEEKVVAIPAFCCGVMATPFLSKGFKIIWIDTDINGNISYKNFVQKNNKSIQTGDKINILLLPAIFGQAVNSVEFYAFCQTHDIFCIADEAHNFVPQNTDKPVAIPFFDAKILSFGREKTFSCVSGGAVIWNDSTIFPRKFENIKLPPASKSWTFRHLFQIFTYSIALPIWFYGGKILPFIALKLKLLPLAVTHKEKQGQEDFPETNLPYALQKILHHQLSQARKIQQHRQLIAETWCKHIAQYFPNLKIIIPPNYFRVILIFPNLSERQAFLKKSQQIGFYFREWDGIPISPKGVDFSAFQYISQQCPQAEKFSQHYVTLPTHIRLNQADISKFFNTFK